MSFCFLVFYIPLMTLRKTALPQRSSLRLVNWWTLHLASDQAASSYSRSDQLHSASKIGFTADRTLE